MLNGPFVRSLVAITLFTLALGGRSAEAQSVRVEAGGGWAFPSGTVTMTDAEENTPDPEVDTDSGPNTYAAVGLVWTLSENLALEGRVRGQQSQLRVKASAFRNPRCNRQCEFLNDPSGHVRGLTFEGQLTLTSVGRINPYFLVGLGVVRTVVDAARVEAIAGEQITYSEARVTDAGGDVGFGATTRLTGDLRLTAETRVMGSLPGAKDNAITTFPFTLGLSYEL